ncbi:phosphotransferase enzyme family protein [Anaerosporobacter faecicola]|uniref:phosphotransferase enzyme family protein n=1 Tax=Anaerosporobacter faecicola TaxID=2718714 RepID=UPI00143B86A1|nr:phosphotransferase [Anaerosporobacter faecicola]
MVVLILKLKNLIENDNVAQQLIEHYAFEKVEFGFLRSSSNVIYWVKADGKVYFLRYTTEDERNIESIQGEIAYILYLREQGIQANQPVMTKEGNYVIQENGFLGVLFACVDGEPLEELDITPKVAREWGSQLGKLHKLSSTKRLEKKGVACQRADFKEAFAWIHTILTNAKEQELQEIATQLEQSFQTIEKTESNYGLCHYDLELDNVFWDEEKEEMSIIDFDDSMYHFYAIDLVQIFMNIEEDIPEDRQSLVKEEVMKGYMEDMPAPTEQELNLAKQFVILLGYCKLAYCLAYPPELSPDWMKPLVDKLQNAKKMKYQILTGKALADAGSHF